MAISVDYAACPACGKQNPKLPTVSECRDCKAPLPWSKTGAKDGASKTSAINPAASSPAVNQKERIGIGDVAWAAMGVQILGGVIFVAGAFFWAGNKFGFFPTFPGLGWITMAVGGVLWGKGSTME